MILTQKIFFCHLLKYLSKMDLSVVLNTTLSDYHRLRRLLHGLLHCSYESIVYPTLELICDFQPSKFFHYPSRPATRKFSHYSTQSRPEVKNHYPSVSAGVSTTQKIVQRPTPFLTRHSACRMSPNTASSHGLTRYHDAAMHCNVDKMTDGKDD